MDSSFLSDTFCLPVDIPTGGENRGSTDTGLTTTVCRNGTESRDSLPLWNGAERGNGSERPLGGTATKPACRNGTESRESLPLWNGAERGNGSERPLEGAATKPACHNGTESRESLPLWNGVVVRVEVESPAQVA